MSEMGLHYNVLLVMLILQLLLVTVLIRGESKLLFGQRIFVQVPMVDKLDPTRFGFQIILNQQFVETYLQKANVPTVFLSAVPLNQNSSVGTRDSRGNGRVTKVFYPDRDDPRFLDSRLVRISDLAENSWYFLCLEFESYVDRHALSTGMQCTLSRTLDKFGQSSSSTITKLSDDDVSDRSLIVKLVIEVDFPVLYQIYLRGNDGKTESPAQTFVVRRDQTLRVKFDRLSPETVYDLCVIEQPFRFAYTAMGRPIYAEIDRCRLLNVKTKRSSNSGFSDQLPITDRLMENIRIVGNTNSGCGYCSIRKFRFPIICTIAILLLIRSI